MLQNLSREIRYCHGRAEECKRLAATALTDDIKADFLDMERRWFFLAGPQLRIFRTVIELHSTVPQRQTGQGVAVLIAPMGTSGAPTVFPERSPHPKDCLLAPMRVPETPLDLPLDCHNSGGVLVTAVERKFPRYRLEHSDLRGRYFVAPSNQNEAFSNRYRKRGLFGFNRLGDDGECAIQYQPERLPA
jgi:hypothetical protein